VSLSPDPEIKTDLPPPK